VLERIYGWYRFEGVDRGLWCIDFFRYGLCALGGGRSFCVRVLAGVGRGAEGWGKR